MPVGHLTIGELADRSGVAASALRYYEAQGLIESERTTGNQRRYRRVTLRRVAFVRAAQRVGLTLDDGDQLDAQLVEAPPQLQQVHRIAAQPIDWASGREVR